MTTGPRIYSSFVAPEVLVVAGCLVTLVLCALPPLLGIWVGAALAGGSLVFGMLAGLAYHVRLYGALAPMARGWWWNPTRQHVRLDRGQRRQVMPWFLAGALGFVGAMVGCLGFLSAALRL